MLVSAESSEAARVLPKPGGGSLVSDRGSGLAGAVDTDLVPATLLFELASAGASDRGSGVAGAVNTGLVPAAVLFELAPAGTGISLAEAETGTASICFADTLLSRAT